MPNHRLFPLVRLLSAPTTRLLLRTPVSANAVTTASMLAGLGAAVCFSINDARAARAGSVLFVLCYVLDNADGEIARARRTCTRFGAAYDTFSDWLVHAAVFIGLGLGTSARFDDPLWFWLGASAAAGSTVNYLLGIAAEFRAEHGTGTAQDAAEDAGPAGILEWIVFILRETFRADFCFLVLVLAVFDAAWVLLPAAAVGAHVYWLAGLVPRVRRFHT